MARKGKKKSMNGMQKQVIEETAAMEKKRRETQEKLKAWASGETSLYDEKGMRVSSSP